MECTYPFLIEVRENPELHDLMRMDKGHWPRCLLWHGWLPVLSGENGASSWAEGAGNLPECALGSDSSRLLRKWDVLDELNKGDVAQRVLANPNVWTDGSLLLDKVFGTSSAGSGVCAHVSGRTWRHRWWAFG